MKSLELFHDFMLFGQPLIVLAIGIVLIKTRTSKPVGIALCVLSPVILLSPMANYEAFISEGLASFCVGPILIIMGSLTLYKHRTALHGNESATTSRKVGQRVRYSIPIALIIIGVVFLSAFPVVTTMMYQYITESIMNANQHSDWYTLGSVAVMSRLGLVLSFDSYN